jgi:hypothetical protein
VFITLLVTFIANISLTKASWQIGEIDVSPPALSRIYIDESIAVTDDGVIHVVYGENYALYHIYWDGTWHFETIESSMNQYDYASISVAVDSSGKVHISCVYFDDNPDLKYATNVSGSWVTEVVDQGTIGYGTSLAIDSQEKVHIIYVHTNDLKYVTNSSGTWVVDMIDSGGVSVESPTLAIDSLDNLHLSYYDDTNKDLKYVTNTTGSWVTATVDSNGYVGDYSSLAIDSQGKVHISYVDYTNYDLKYATNVSGSWVTEIVRWEEPIPFQIFGTFLLLDSSDKAHISYFFYLGGLYEVFRLEILTNASGSWEVEYSVYEEIWSNHCLTIDQTDRLHLIYAYPHGLSTSQTTLAYATNVSGQFVSQWIDGKHFAGIHSSLTLVSSDKSHISYYAHEDLKYAWCEAECGNTANWQKVTLDSNGGSYTSIALDSQDKVHISYYDYTNDDLKYITNATGFWAAETLRWIALEM